MTRDVDLPAILGGRPAVSPADADTLADAVRWPRITEADEAAVLAVVRDGNLSRHSVVHELESDWAAFIGRRHALAHANGTAALLAAYFALDLEPGDEVLVPSATFWATVLPLTWLGLVPVFCESESVRLGLDPVDVERKITPRTKAMVVVHLWGMPSRMSELFDIARRHDLRVVEDASHAHGARWRDRMCGTLGDVSVFSLQGDKLAPAGEGGVLLCDDDRLMERATMLGDIHRILEIQGPNRRFAATSFGVKTRMAPLSAAVGRSQLARLGEHNQLRGDAARCLSERLEALGFDAYLGPPHVERTWFEFVIGVPPDRVPLQPDALVAALRAEGCEVSLPRYPLLHQQPFFTEGHCRSILRLPEDRVPSYAECKLPQTEEAQHRFLRLPAFVTPSRTLLEGYALAFERIVAHGEEVAAARRDQNV